MSQQTDRPVRHVRVTPDAVERAFQQLGVEAWFARDMATLHGMLAAGYEEIITDDVRAATGRPPRTLARFAREFADAFTPQEHNGR